MRSAGAAAPGLVWAEAACFSAVAVWLAWCVANVRAEPYDGLAAICNARHALGLPSIFDFTRSPLYPWLLMPVEWLRQRQALAPCDLRLDHALGALLNGAALLATYALVTHCCGRRPATLLACVLALVTPIWLGQASFLSVDIVPGALFLAAVVAACTHSPTRGWPVLAACAAALTAAALLKWQFLALWGVVWLAALLAHPRGAAAWRSRMALALRLAGLSLASAGLVYGILDVSWASRFPAVAPGWRVPAGLAVLVGRHREIDVEPTWWLYLRHLPA